MILKWSWKNSLDLDFFSYNWRIFSLSWKEGWCYLSRRGNKSFRFSVFIFYFLICSYFFSFLNSRCDFVLDFFDLIALKGKREFALNRIAVRDKNNHLELLHKNLKKNLWKGKNWPEVKRKERQQTDTNT